MIQDYWIPAEIVFISHIYVGGLQAAGNAVKRATEALVRAAQQVKEDWAYDDGNLQVNQRMVGGIAQVGVCPIACDWCPACEPVLCHGLYISRPVYSALVNTIHHSYVVLFITWMDWHWRHQMIYRFIHTNQVILYQTFRSSSGNVGHYVYLTK